MTPTPLPSTFAPTPAPTIDPLDGHPVLSIFTSILATYGLSLAIACTCYICMRRHPPDSRSDAQLQREAEAGRRQSNDTPPNFAPTPFRDTKASTDKGNDEEPVLCSICLCTFELDSPTIELHCGHVYHKECLDEWLGVSTLCPLCKRVCEAEEESKSDDREEAFWRSWFSRRRRAERNDGISIEQIRAGEQSWEDEAAVQNQSPPRRNDSRRDRDDRSWPPPPPPPPLPALSGDDFSNGPTPNRLEQDMVDQGLELIAEEGDSEEEMEWIENFEAQSYQLGGPDVEAQTATYDGPTEVDDEVDRHREAEGP